MRTRNLLTGLILGTGLLIGCEDTGTRDTRDIGTPRTTPGTTVPTDQNQQRAQTLIDQINEHIENRDFAAADTALIELESMRANLSASMQQQIDSLRTRLNTARGVTVPTVPNRPTLPPPTTPPATPPTTPPSEPDRR